MNEQDAEAAARTSGEEPWWLNGCIFAQPFVKVFRAATQRAALSRRATVVRP
jgi:hypothetical protein